MKKINKYLLFKILIFGFLFVLSNSLIAQIDFYAIGSTGFTPGTSTTVQIEISSPTTSVQGWDMNISYDKNVLTYVSITKYYPTTASLDWYVDTTGNPNGIQMGYSDISTGNAHLYPNNTLVCTLTFTYNGGVTALTVDDGAGGFYDASYDYLSANLHNGTVSGSYVNITSVSGGGNWSDPTKWDLSHVPNSTNSVIIASTPSTPLTVDASNTVYGDLTINSGGALTINSGKILTVNGNFTINSDATGTGSFINNGTYTAATTTVQKYLPAWPSTTSSQGWHMISSPVAGNALTNFTPSPASSYDFFKWDEPTVQWLDQKIPANNITSFLSGVGYMVSYQNAGTHNFSGSLTTSDVSPTITYTVQSPVSPSQAFNLIGNPYTSALDATNITSWTKSNVNSYVYVYDDNNAIYRSWNGTTGNLTNNIIPAMQAFMVKSNGASPSITIPAASRVHNAQNLYKSTIDNVVDLTVTSQNGFWDEAFVYFSNSATNELDQSTDVPKLVSPVQQVPELYSYIGSDKFAINAMGPHISATIPLGFEPGINGKFTIKANDLNSFAANNVIILQDLKTGINQDLMQNNTYTFMANTTDNVNRFILNFNSPLGINENTANTPSKIYSYENTIFVNCTEVVKQISIYNAIGQIIYTVDNPTGLVKYSLNGNNTTGYYIVRVISDKNVNSEKVFVK